MILKINILDDGGEKLNEALIRAWEDLD